MTSKSEFDANIALAQARVRKHTEIAGRATTDAAFRDQIRLASDALQRERKLRAERARLFAIPF